MAALSLTQIARLVERWNGYAEDLMDAESKPLIMQDAKEHKIGCLFADEEVIEPYGCIGVLIGRLVDEDELDSLKAELSDECQVYAMSEEELMDL